ncbi:MAG: response regulator transcription factor [Candidatus Krumholzibacteriota bacterium]|nr:response regulator transcription factor [Candidatus Krumholzibacteriota bacterium]
MANERILIVDDDPQTLRMLSVSVEKAGYEVMPAETGEEALRLAKEEGPDLVVLDLVLPDSSGLEVCRELREAPETQGIPLIMVTALGEQSDKIYGLEVGADDYMVKPIDVPELLARIRALFRRQQLAMEAGEGNGRGGTLELGGFSIQPERLSVMREDKSVTLTALEFKLLYQLASKPEETFSRTELQQLVWGDDQRNTERAVDVLVNRLRSKLEKLPGGDAIVKTVRGVGYRFHS